MHVIEKHFAWSSIVLDRKETAKIRRDEIISIGMLCNPEVTGQYLRHLELEEEMTDEDKKYVEEEKVREMTETGAVKSDPVVQKMIRMKNEMDKTQQPIETLSDIVDANDA